MAQESPGPLGKLLGALLGALLLIAGFMFSLVAFGVIALLAIGVGAWFWWKTRALRRQMQEQMADIQRTMEAESGTTAENEVIEGEFIREGQARPNRTVGHQADEGTPPEKP